MRQSLFITIFLMACSGSDPAAPTADAAGDSEKDSGTAAESAPSCFELECTTYACRCKNGMSIDSSRCTDGVCLDGSEVCTSLCEGKGGVSSANPKTTTMPDTGAPDTAAPPKCIGGGDPCGDCSAANCCAEATACGADMTCVNSTICLAGCKDGFAACVAKCDPSMGMKFRTYTQCLEAKGCSSKCGS